MKRGVTLAALLAVSALGAQPSGGRPGAASGDADARFIFPAPATVNFDAAKEGGSNAEAVVRENGRFVLTAPARVGFGHGTAKVEKEFSAGTHVCEREVFGSDPAPGAAKECRPVASRPAATSLLAMAAPAPAIPMEPATVLAAEGAAFTLPGSTTVRFGAGTTTVSRTLPKGRHMCGRDAFGTEPVPGMAKACYGPARAARAASPAVPVPPIESDISEPGAYRAVAASMGTDAGITYRYGAPSSQPLPATSYPGPRPNRSYLTVSGQRKEVQKDGKPGNRGCGRDSWCGEYQIGDFLTGDPLDYSSNIVNVAYVPTVPVPAGFRESKYWGVASLQSLGVNHNTVSIKPEPSWTTYTGPLGNNGDNDENTRRVAGAASGSPIGSTGLKGCPVANTRGYGRGGWVTNTLTVDCEGRITSSGSNTAHNFINHKLPDGKMPTAIAISNSGEFAFVTVWDTAALKGQVAVLALTDGCQWCETKPEKDWGGDWGNHRQRYPGLPGLGNYLDIKLVGFVDLPEGMKAPTEIAVTTGNDGGRDTGYQVVMNFWNEPLTSAAHRRRILDGAWAPAVARTGMAVVISKSEKRAAFIDLRPLFTYYRDQYFAKDPAGWDALLAARGPAPDQWPYSFDVAPAQRPTLIKVVGFDSKPTAVEMSRRSPHRALIATEEGRLRVFDLGDNYLDQGGLARGTPGEIGERFSVPVGRNPTSIAYFKEKARFGPGNASLLFGAGRTEDQHWWVLSREERKATLLQFDAGMASAKPIRTLRTRQIADPIAIEDGDNHGTESYVLTVADYAGSAVHNLWYGPIVMWTHDRRAPCTRQKPCLPRGGVELAGTHRLPGKPFHLSSANIN